MTFLKRWVFPRLGKIFASASFIISLLFFISSGLLALFCNIESSTQIKDVSNSIFSISSIGLGISMALGAITLALPLESNLSLINYETTNEYNNRVRCNQSREVPLPPDTPYTGLAFTAFWAGIANLIAVFSALIALVVCGEEKLFLDSSLLAIFFSSLVLSSIIYALIEMMFALNAMLQLSGNISILKIRLIDGK